MQILLVEDDKSIRDVLNTYICDVSQGRHCEMAKTLAEAIALVTRKRFDFIFLDLLLPDGMGTPLIPYAKQLYPYNTPQICVTSAMHGSAKIAEENGVIYLSKPFALDILDELLLNIKTA